MQDPYSDPQTRGFFDQVMRNYGSGAYNRKTSSVYNQAGVTGANLVTRGGIGAGLLGMTDLTKMLANEGRSDPRVLGSQVAAIGRGTQSSQDAARGSLAGGGWQNLGLGKVLEAAIGQQGQQRVANTYAADADKAYGRNQANLGLLKSLVLDPQRDYAAIGAGQYGSDKAAQQAKQAGIVGAIGSILSALL